MSRMLLVKVSKLKNQFALKKKKKASKCKSQKSIWGFDVRFYEYCKIDSIGFWGCCNIGAFGVGIFRVLQFKNLPDF